MLTARFTDDFGSLRCSVTVSVASPWAMTIFRSIFEAQAAIQVHSLPHAEDYEPGKKKVRFSCLVFIALTF
jgi:hypothetical protein